MTMLPTLSSSATAFAPADRADAADVQRQADELAHADFLIAVSNAVPNAVLVLNGQRQIVYASAPLKAFLPEPKPASVIGLRPGEALACIHASENQGGCGTSEFCQECGAVDAILAAQTGQAALRECRIVRRSQGAEEALDLRVQATPFAFRGEPFVIFSIADISHEKRRLFLERTFFHDLNNTAGIISSLVHYLGHRDEATVDLPIPDMLAEASGRLREEIQAQRQLVDAENHEMKLHWSEVDTGDVLTELARLFGQHEVAAGRRVSLATASERVTLATASERVTLATDRTLLGRILGNVVKNGLEASLPGETVTIGCVRRETGTCFWVHNSAVMPPSVQRQVFQRSFSTKGSGRGLGTYSIKLLGERYLGGCVAFTSAEPHGTTLTLTLPDERPLASGVIPV